MSWLFGVKKQVPDMSGAMLPPPPDGNEPDKSSAGSKAVGAKSEYHFDSTALERAAKAAKDLEQSKYAKDALEITRMQEQTLQLEHQQKIKEIEGQIEQMKLDSIRVGQEEQRKTMQEQVKTKQQLAQYEDQLARKRYDDQLAQQARTNEENLRKQEDSLKRQENIRKSTIEYEAELRHKNEMIKLEAELKGRGKIERENHDLHLQELQLNASEYRKTIVDSIQTVGSVLGTGFRVFVSDFNRVIGTAAAFTLLAGGYYSAKYGSGLLMRFVETRLGKPSLVRETSRLTPIQFVRHPVKSVKRIMSKPADVLNGIIFKPELEERLREIAIATRQTKHNRGFYRNILFYGPPGTGKTMFAKSLALHSGLDYALMTGGDVAPLGTQAVTAIHRVFEWARTSRRGVLLFVDEADAFLRKRSQETMDEGQRSALNAFLYHTGEHSKKFMLVMASNQPEQFDWAINDRLDDMIQFALPGNEERDRLVRQYFDLYILQVIAAGRSRLKIDPSYDWSAKCSAVAASLGGFSGREIAKLAISWQASAFASESGTLTPEIVDARVAEAKDAHAHKMLWRDYRVGEEVPTLEIPQVSSPAGRKIQKPATTSSS